MTKKILEVKKYLYILLILGHCNVYAALPTAPAELTENGNDWIKGLIILTSKIFSGVITLIVAIAAISMLCSSWDAFDKARRHGEWKGFGITLSIGVILLGATVFMVTKFKDIFAELIA